MKHESENQIYRNKNYALLYIAKSIDVITARNVPTFFKKVRIMKYLTLLLLTSLIVLPSCYTKTIYVPDQTPVRLRQELKNVKVWVVDALGNIHESTLDLKEGWFIISMPQYSPIKDSDIRETEVYEKLE